MLNPNFSEIKPGDLITAELINYILSHLEDLEDQIELLVGSVGTGPVLVPNLFGRPLATTLSIIGQSAIGLQIGQVIDVFGSPIDPTSGAEGDRIVLHQYPIPGVRVASGSTIDLLVSGEGDGGTGGPPPGSDPVITGFDPNPVRLNEIVTILGNNFAAIPSSNTVTFDGVPGTIQPSSTPQSLDVSVPTNIPNPPTGAGSRAVLVLVVTPNGQVQNTDLRVRAAATNTPTITQILTSAGQNVPPGSGIISVGDNIQITGSNFGTTMDGLAIRFGNQSFDASSLEVIDDQTQRIDVTVPLLEGHAGGQQLITVVLVIQVGQNQSAPFTLRVFNPNI